MVPLARPRLLFIAMPDSVHTARWLNQITDQGWDIRIFPCYHAPVHPLLRNVTVHDLVIHPRGVHPSVRLPGALRWPFPGDARLVTYGMQILRQSRRLTPWRPSHGERLARLIRRWKPDLVQSLELQHSAYLTLEAKKILGAQFPPWIVTNWGSDIYLYRRLPEHREKIVDVLAACDYYSCECCRDVGLAQELGFQGETLPVFPNTGGFNLDRVRPLRQAGPTSQRRVVLIKGYQGWSGRALVALRAVELCAPQLKGYTVAVYLANPDVELAARLVEHETGIPVTIIPHVPHEEMLRWHGRARVSVGVGISDAISTSFLEALVMGSFPVQSWTSCADEWVEDGRSAILVPPNDPEPIAAAICRALADDALVDAAADLNWATACSRLDARTIKPQVVNLYKKLLDRTNSEPHASPCRRGGKG